LLDEFTNFKFVIFNNSVYDISDFRHPGGDFLLSQVLGREIGRFLYGIYNLESLPKFGHRHSIYALNALEKRYIGSFLNNSISQEVTIWRIESKSPLSDTTTLFRFKYEAGTVKSLFDGLEWIGKHFAVKIRINT
jgi:cytochrome b involved in lipid metabolism